MDRLRVDRAWLQGAIERAQRRAAGNSQWSTAEVSVTLQKYGLEPLAAAHATFEQSAHSAFPHLRELQVQLQQERELGMSADACTAPEAAMAVSAGITVSAYRVARMFPCADFTAALHWPLPFELPTAELHNGADAGPGHGAGASADAGNAAMATSARLSPGGVGSSCITELLFALYQQQSQNNGELASGEFAGSVYAHLV